MRLHKHTDDIVVTWDSQAGDDPCVLYRGYVATDPGRPDDLSKYDYAGTTTRETHAHRGVLLDASTRYDLITGTSLATGEGPLGHYGR